MSIAITVLQAWLAIYVLLAGLTWSIGVWVETQTRARTDKIQPGKHATEWQVARDKRQSFISLIGISFFFALGHGMHAALGWGWRAPELSFTSVLLSFAASMLIFDAWFYWGHRLLHTRLLFRRVHRWHHLSVAPTSWSNNSDTFLDNLFLQSYWIVAHFILPIAPVVLLVHKVFDQVSGLLGHSGYEYAGKIALPGSPLLSTTHHDQHHQYFTCNFATHFCHWDRWMGTMHPHYDEQARINITAAAAQPHLREERSS